MIYCISDIHGCYDEFMELLKKIKFNENDTLYVLGDAVDRGTKPIETLRFIMQTPNVHFLIGNHEQMMMDYYKREISGILNWNKYNGSSSTKKQVKKLEKEERNKILRFLGECPYYVNINVNGNAYLLVHAGIDPKVPFSKQEKEVMVWVREEFIFNKALKDIICIFGHTPTKHIRHSDDYSVWFDTEHKDKVCIDSGCAYGGALAALRLDDMKMFYVESY